ncbi:glutathione S-transferase family protein [Alisedimentitalea sp. MJ-SS2]|uniref:glutathione S-transferase family protein n=1 Tax=Aliisedimentitalea sp. MJ-SS2 TaxID=3049795 RepID=UPI002907803E|nr:glutathione S-transferase family protein [Alisedimentitalea sp. MJ-SS2]MDU8927212.1 glutathione S-transferase family protein [Alisedimentitalea sp. MJ-SS2]
MTEYALYYHPIPFRGHFIRYVLAYVGVDWEEPGHDEVLRLKALPVQDQPYPFMAPPMLHHRIEDVWLAQLPAILTYLGKTHLLMPALPEGEAQVQKVIADCNDVLEEITCDCGARMWNAESWASFHNNRLPRWLEVFEATARAHRMDRKGVFLLGTSEPSLADLATAALWHTICDKMPELDAVVRAHAPEIHALSYQIADLARIREMRARLDALWGNAYCGGEIEVSLREMLKREDDT